MASLDRLRADTAGQRGYFTRRQAHAGGFTDAMLRSRVKSGHLEKIGVGAYSSPLQPANPIAALHALLLDIGAPVWASGPTAAAVLGLPGFVLSDPFSLLVPRGRNIVLGYRWHRTKTQLQRDSQRLNALLLRGYRVLQLTYDDITLRPGEMVCAIRAIRAARK